MKKYIFSPLCSTYPTFYPISLAPFLSLPALSFLPFMPPLFCFVRRGSSYEPEMLLWRFHKQLRFQPLSRRMARAAVAAAAKERGDISKASFTAAITRPISHSPFLFFLSILTTPHHCRFWCNVRTEKTGGKKQSAGC